MSDSFGNDDMRPFGAFSDDAIEQILSGRETANEDLSPLVDFVAALRAETTRAPDETVADQRVAAAVEAVDESLAPQQLEPTQTGRITRRSWRSSALRTLKSRAAAALAVVGLLAGGSGIAWAADHSAPGDLLYGLDTALETFGIFDGGDNERLEEARALVESGDFAGGLGAAANSVSQAGIEDASDSLEDAADKVEENAGEAPEAVQTGVVGLLDYLASLGDVSQADPQTVTIMAQAIADGITNADAGITADRVDDPPPVDTPPVTDPPPVDTPPVTDPPPVDIPPVTDPPPVDTPPVTDPPPVPTEAPVDTPPVSTEAPLDPPPVSTDPPVSIP